MREAQSFRRRGIVEGFFGPVWSMAHREALFEFGAARGMNTYLYAPKDDPYHRARWTEPYPPAAWRSLRRLIRAAERHRIDFVYGFHPGKGLSFSAEKPITCLLEKARRFYDSGVKTFTVLFDDIPSHLDHVLDRNKFKGSLARAEGTWLARIQSRQPSHWKDVEWWICPSYYTPDPLLARVFGVFEDDFLEVLGECLPADVACFWTGPAVVPRKITAAHVKRIAARLKHRLLLWDNYPVNDLSMSDELHIGPLQGRDSELPKIVHGYLNNPLLQEELSFLPLSTCFDYARSPRTYDPERSWKKAVVECYGNETLAFWRAIRHFCEKTCSAKHRRIKPRWSRRERAVVQSAIAYIGSHKIEKWALEIKPWGEAMKKTVSER